MIEWKRVVTRKEDRMSGSSYHKLGGAVPAIVMVLALATSAPAATLPIVREFPTPGGLSAGMAFVLAALIVGLVKRRLQHGG